MLLLFFSVDLKHSSITFFNPPTDLKTATGTCSTDTFKLPLKTWLFKRACDWYTDH